MLRESVVMALIALAGCAVPQQRGAAAVHSITARVEIVPMKDPSRTPRAIAEAVARFPLIAGSIVGSPNTPSIFIRRVRVGQSIPLDLKKLRDDVARLASPVSSGTAAAGLAVEPQEARFARVGTFIDDPATGENIAVGSFLEPATRTAVALVYFDRPCRLSGVLRLGTREAQHDVVIRAAGFHWIAVKVVGPGRFFIKESDPIEDVILAIEPHEARS